MIYLLDTNVIMHLANEVAGSEGIERNMRAVGVAHMRLSAIAFTELRHKVMSGAGRVKAVRLERLRVIVEGMTVEPYTVAAAEFAAQLMTDLQATGKRNEWPDIMIAGHAIASGYTLVTDDAALLSIQSVKAVNWRD